MCAGAQRNEISIRSDATFRRTQADRIHMVMASLSRKPVATFGGCQQSGRSVAGEAEISDVPDDDADQGHIAGDNGPVGHHFGNARIEPMRSA